MSASGAPPQTPPDSADGTPPRRWKLGRTRTRIAIAAAAVLLLLVIAAAVAVTMRDSPPPLDEARVGTIASDVVEKAIKDLQAAARDLGCRLPADPARRSS